VTVWGPQAQNYKHYLSKGRAVAIDGRLEWRECEARDRPSARWSRSLATPVPFLSPASEMQTPQSNVATTSRTHEVPALAPLKLESVLPASEPRSFARTWPMSLTNRIAIVTGASRGIGAAIVETLAERGATVIASAHTVDPPDALVAELEARGLRVRGRIADVTDPEQVQDLADSTEHEYGRIDLLVNNAGIGAVAPSETLSLERWSRVLAVNLTGPLLCSQAVGQHMLDAGRGAIINIGSIFGETGMPMRAAYAASKHGLVGLTRVLAIEWASRGVRVVTVEPAYVRTRLDDQDQKDGGYSANDIIGRTPLGRYGEPHEIGATVAFLASDEASFITGATIPVDGGWLAYGGW